MTNSTFAAISVTLSGCNTGKAPAKADLVAKLKTESSFAGAKALGTDAQYDQLVGCIADFLLKKGRKLEGHAPVME